MHPIFFKPTLCSEEPPHILSKIEFRITQQSNSFIDLLRCGSWDAAHKIVHNLLVHEKALFKDRVTFLGSSLWGIMDDSTTFLHLAALNAEADVLEVLANGDSLKIQNEEGSTALHKAIEKARDLSVIKILANKDTILIKDKNGDNAFHIAVRKGRLDIVQYLISLDPNLFTIRNGSGNSSLNIAAFHGYEAVVDFFLELNPSLELLKEAYETSEDSINFFQSEGLKNMYIRISKKLEKKISRLSFCCELASAQNVSLEGTQSIHRFSRNSIFEPRLIKLVWGFVEQES